MAAEANEAGGAAAAAPPGEPKGPLLIALGNTLLIVGALALTVYSKLVFKRPRITESAERARIEEMAQARKAPSEPGLIHFDQMLINIKANPDNPKPSEDGSGGIQGKMHYATLAFSLKVQDMSRRDEVEQLRPIIQDRMLQLLGRKTYSELITVQGRYHLKTEMLDLINDLFDDKEKRKSSVVLDVYLNQFMVQ